MNSLKRYILTSSYKKDVLGVQIEMKPDLNGPYARAEDCKANGVTGKRFSFYLGFGDFDDRKVGFVECSDMPDEVTWIELDDSFQTQGH